MREGLGSGDQPRQGELRQEDMVGCVSIDCEAVDIESIERPKILPTRAIAETQPVARLGKGGSERRHLGDGSPHRVGYGDDRLLELRLDLGSRAHQLVCELGGRDRLQHAMSPCVGADVHPRSPESPHVIPGHDVVLDEFRIDRVAPGSVGRSRQGPQEPFQIQARAALDDVVEPSLHVGGPDADVELDWFGQGEREVPSPCVLDDPAHTVAPEEPPLPDVPRGYEERCTESVAL